jgi:hypothetical protein
MEGRRKIDGEAVIPPVDWKFFDRRRLPEDSVVDENVNAAKCSRYRRNHFLDFGWSSQVGAAVKGLHAKRGFETLPDARGEFRGTEPIQQPLCGGQSQALQRTGNEGTFSFQRHGGANLN